MKKKYNFGTDQLFLHISGLKAKKVPPPQKEVVV